MFNYIITFSLFKLRRQSLFILCEADKMDTIEGDCRVAEGEFSLLLPEAKIS